MALRLAVFDRLSRAFASRRVAVSAVMIAAGEAEYALARDSTADIIVRRVYIAMETARLNDIDRAAEEAW